MTTTDTTSSIKDYTYYVSYPETPNGQFGYIYKSFEVSHPLSERCFYFMIGCDLYLTTDLVTEALTVETKELSAYKSITVFMPNDECLDDYLFDNIVRYDGLLLCGLNETEEHADGLDLAYETYYKTLEAVAEFNSLITDTIDNLAHEVQS